MKDDALTMIPSLLSVETAHNIIMDMVLAVHVWSGILCDSTSHTISQIIHTIDLFN